MEDLPRHKKFPHIDLQLITALEKHFPDSVPNSYDTDREVWIKVGNVEVIRFLKLILAEQTENSLAI